MTFRFLAIILLSVSIVAPTVHAQRVGVSLRSQDSVVLQPRNAGAIRFGGAVGGAVIGAIGGAFLGYNILPHNCGCDDPGLDELIMGGLAGTAIGAAFGAAAANLNSQCDFATRLKRSLLGSTLGGIAAYFVAGGSGSEGTVIAVPAAAVGGSLAGLGRCWRAGR